MITIKYDKPKKLKLCEQCIYVFFEYKQEIINVIRLIEERNYDVKNKIWELPSYELDFLKKNLPNEQFDIIGAKKEHKALTKSKTTKHFKLPANLKTKPYNYQQDGIDFICSSKKQLLLDSCGLGKSLMAISSALIRKESDLISHVLVLTGRCSLIWNWYAEIKMHTGIKATVLGSRKNKKGKWHVKNNADKLEDLNNIKDNQLFLLTNIQSLQNKDVASKIRQLIDKDVIQYVIFDEAHCVRNPSSIQAKALLKLNPDYILAMTGTPIVNNPLDSYVPLKWIGKVSSNYTAYKNHFCRFGNFNAIVGFKHLDEIKTMMDSVSLRRLKSDVLELPPKVITKEILDLTSKQQTMYNNIVKDILDNIDKIESVPNMLAQMLRVRQVTETTELLSTEVKESSKIARVKEMLEDLPKEEKVIIFTWFAESAEILKRELLEYNPAIFTGKTKNRQEEMNRFKADSSCRVIIATIKAMGTGFTLNEASTMIFMSLPWTASDFTQACDRAYRIGTQSTLNIYIMLARNTVDEKIYDIVMKKQSMQDCLIDNSLSVKELTEMLVK